MLELLLGLNGNESRMINYLADKIMPGMSLMLSG